MNAPFSQLRRRLALAGGRPSASAVESGQGRRDDAEYRPATLLDPPLRHLPVGDAEPWTEDVAFLDGTQHAELIGYVGTAPIIGAVVRAAVRLRHDRKFGLAAERARRLVIGRRDALDAFGELPAGYEPVVFDDESDPHPIRDAQSARGLVDRARAGLEIEVAREFRTGEALVLSAAKDLKPPCDTNPGGPSLRSGRGAWLVVDGSLAASPDWSTDPRMIGVVKSHAMLPFMGDELETYLTLPRGHRTSLFAPESRRVTPLYSWALRLHDFAGRDLFHGLVRIEAPATDETRERADTISRHLLAERAPMSNDPRADRLLYGIHDVERYLGAQGA
jgi:hypothetical protein